MFSRKNWRELDYAHQSKKLADLLGANLLEPTGGAQDEYKQLVEWTRTEHPASRPPEQETWSRARQYELYIFWRREAGLGPEQRILEALAPAGDRPTAAAAPIPYEVLLHNVRSGYNAGAVTRSAECLGFSRVLLSGFTPGPENAAFRAAAMGAESWIEVNRLDSPRGDAREAPPLIALENVADAPTIHEIPWPPRGRLLVGNEELGLDEELLNQADYTARIPLFGRKASYNLSVAFALAGYEIRRTRERPA